MGVTDSTVEKRVELLEAAEEALAAEAIGAMDKWGALTRAINEALDATYAKRARLAR